jgi:(1->4)-alpha-D-glucan 1-alpha-D-glucosylmutase
VRIPISTYRLQFTPSFGFQSARSILLYLSDLGISDIYASPIFKAKRGSTHGYDVIDPNQINPELGGEKDFNDLACTVKEHQLGWVQDIVPNHMAFDSENHMLMDVLENGSASPYYKYFDVDWNHPYESLRGKILAPFLGKFYGECLEDGEIQLTYDVKGLAIKYYDLQLPLKIESYGKVFTHNLQALKRKLGAEHPDVIKFLGVLYSLKNLPSAEESKERADQITFIKRLLWELYTTSQKVKAFVDGNIRTFNGQKGNPESFNLLDDLLSDQLFRLSFWKVATEEINYRRFFNINQLICLRVEDEDVLRGTHASVFKLAKQGHVTGLRVDHIDGLYDPTTYLQRVRAAVGDIYFVVEKILQSDEQLPSHWPVQGTTGYDFLNYVNGVFCERRNEKRFEKIYAKFTGGRTPYDSLVADTKRLMIGRHMAGDIDQLAHLVKDVASRDRHGRDVTMYGLRRALVEVLALFPVYRTYINATTYDERDREYVRQAIRKAKQSNPALSLELDFVEKFLFLDFYDYLSQSEKEKWLHFVMRLQQLTGPLMAKGFEDTFLYRYNVLVSLNEVGGKPNRFGISPVEFHYLNKKRISQWPYPMNATSTHDTKRGEDVRARINVLSELPDEWEGKVRMWFKMNRGKKRVVDGRAIPDPNDEYLFYQTLIGAFPFHDDERTEFVERVSNYMIKAVREAKVHTAWLKPDEEYEQAFVAFIEETLRPSEQNYFLNELIPFQKKVAHYGVFNSLSQVLLKITCPGVPDFYQGSELWDLNLVDPDNRRPVDFERRRKYLAEVKKREGGEIVPFVRELLATKEDGRIKLFTIHRALQARKRFREVFETGDYLPLKVSGKHRDHVVAFARRLEDSWALTIAPRRFASLVPPNDLPLGRTIWEDTAVELPDHRPGEWRHVFTERILRDRGSLAMAEVCEDFPVGLLVREDRS